MSRRIHLLAGTRNPPAAVDRFYTSHHSREIPRHRQVAACEFLQSSQAMLAVIDRVGLVQVQQFGQFTCKLPRRPRTNCRIVSALVSRMASITSLLLASRTATEIVAWCTSSPIY